MITYIRNHFHPLWRLRRWSWFRRAHTWIDFPVYKTVGKIKLAAFWLRDISYLVSPDSAEQKTGCCFDAVLAGFKPNRFLDVGANIGGYSWRAFNLTEKTEIWMFEPDIENVRLLSLTIARNNLQRVKLHAAAVSDENGEFQFLVDSVSGSTGSLANHASNTWSLHHAYGMSATRTVPCVTLDSFAEELAGKRVLIKVDVEGGEDRVLLGARRILKEVRPVILIECYDLHKIAWLAEIDYLIHNLNECANFLAFPAELKEQAEREWLG